MMLSSPSSQPIRYGSRDGSALTNTNGNTSGCCPMCGRMPPSARALYCDDACKQRAFRLRHQTLTSVDLGQLRRDLQRRRTLVAHTVYECSTCLRFVSSKSTSVGPSRDEELERRIPI